MNEASRDYAKKNNVYLWQVADTLGVSESTLCKKMRHEFKDKDREAFINAVNQIVEERNITGC